MKYKVVGKTNGWIAQRDSLFKGKTYITLREGLTLKEAQEYLLQCFNEDYETAYSNWGHARRHRPHETATYKDGTRQYEYDSRYYLIEEDNSE